MAVLLEELAEGIGIAGSGLLQQQLGRLHGGSHASLTVGEKGGEMSRTPASILVCPARPTNHWPRSSATVAGTKFATYCSQAAER